ncbi:MAG: hypothetical protein E6J61_06360 [Deltaproteobacteria bacterium]|nr:MAG: hypothetical protein E6J61_06360 [Deltaproteobacteria bacterium]
MRTTRSRPKPHSLSLLLPLLALAIPAYAQVDPGPRGGVANAGGPLAGLSAVEVSAFNDAKAVFAEIDSVSGGIAGEDGSGLGPTFNANSCASCHAQPAVGGTSPHPTLGQVRRSNPQIAFATLDRLAGRNQTVPSFILASEEQLTSRFASTATQRANFGIGGHFNRNGNDGSITRFGWKAQNKSLLIFAGEAYNVEQGVTNELFQNERGGDENCEANPTPEDHSHFLNGTSTTGTLAQLSSDAVNFANFMRLLAPPATTINTASELNGQSLFNSVGCNLCHTTTMVSEESVLTGQTNVTYHPFSDFAVHHMGTGLADGVSQGNAGGDEFRSAPLWGAGQRIFFLHDGRAGPGNGGLMKAIQEHSSTGSEANTVISRFNNLLTPSQKQDILNFLRAL